MYFYAYSHLHNGCCKVVIFQKIAGKIFTKCLRNIAEIKITSHYLQALLCDVKSEKVSKHYCIRSKIYVIHSVLQLAPLSFAHDTSEYRATSSILNASKIKYP